jgi:hypothetical protein
VRFASVLALAQLLVIPASAQRPELSPGRPGYAPARDRYRQLRCEGLSEPQIAGVMGGNLLRVLRQTQAGAAQS